MFKIQMPDPLDDVELITRYNTFKPLVRDENGKLNWIKGYTNINDIRNKYFLRDVEYIRPVEDGELIEIPYSNYTMACLIYYHIFPDFVPCLEEIYRQIDTRTIDNMYGTIDGHKSNSIDDCNVYFKPCAFEIIDMPSKENCDDPIRRELFNAGYYLCNIKFYSPANAEFGVAPDFPIGV